MRPIPGQPGLFRLRGLRGLSDLEADIRVKLAAVESSFNTTSTNTQKLFARFGPLSEAQILTLGAAIKTVKQRDPQAFVRISAAQFAGVARMGLAAAKGNISRAESIVNGGRIAGNESILSSLLDAAQNVIDAVGSVVNSSTEAIGTATGYTSAITLGGLRRGRGLSGALGVAVADDIVIAAIIAAGVLVVVAILAGVYVYTQQSRNASIAADQACATAAASGHPCTAGDWSAARTQATQNERTLSPVPNLQPVIEAAGSAVFWGGILVAAAVVGYAVWTTLPAATVARGRLTARAGMSGLHGTPAEHHAKAEQLLGKARREIERGRYMDALVSAASANAESQWTNDSRLKGATYHETVRAEEGLRREMG